MATSVQGFYAVYGDVFRRIASEEAQYREASQGDDEHLPEFGMPIQLILMIPVNREYFIVKIFSDSQACGKIECAKIHA